MGLRARLVAAFVCVAALATLVSTVLTSIGLHDRFNSYLQQRTDDATRSALTIAEQTYAEEAAWTNRGLDLLAHELTLTGYDFRLTSRGRVLLDTTKLELESTGFRRVSSRSVRVDGTDVGTLEVYALGPRGNLPADDTLRAELDRAHLVAALIAAAVAIIAGLVVAGRLSRPLRRLAEATRGLGSGAPLPPLSSGSPEVREVGHALVGLAENLDRQQRARLQLAQDLSHELRTPLMLLQSRIEAMQDGVLPFDADGLAALHTQTLRLSRLIGQIERLAEDEAHPPPLKSEPLALDELARETHGTLAGAFDIQGLRLIIKAEPASALGDRDAVTQIITNLLSNALKYTPSGGAVSITTSSDADFATLTVSAENVVVPDAEAARLFDRFYRGSGAAVMSGGSGLGLTIARGLAQLQRGRLEVVSGEAGTSFTLTLPAGRATDGPDGDAHPRDPAGLAEIWTVNQDGAGR